MAQTCGLFKLSDEILLEIIAIVLDPKNATRSIHYRKRLPLPLLLSHISSRLRDLVLGTPEFWVTLNSSVLKSSALLEEFLIRSKEKLLDVKVVTYTDKEKVDQLVAHAGRWRQFILTSGDPFNKDGFHYIIKSLRDISAPHLEYLRTEMLDIDEYCDMPIRIFSGGTPSIHTLDLVTDIPTFPRHISTLKRLRLHTFPGAISTLTYAALCDLFEEMSSLTHLQLIGQVVERWPTDWETRPVVMPSLKFLDVWLLEDSEFDIPPHCVSALLSTISTQSLRHLSLSYMSPEVLSCFFDNLRAGDFDFCSVTSLALQDEPEEMDDVELLVQAFPNVEILTLRDCGDIFLKTLLAQEEESPLLWPRLRRINLHYWIEFPLLQEFISDRMRIGQPIQVRLAKSQDQREKGKELARLRTQIDLKIISYNTLKREATGWDKTA